MTAMMTKSIESSKDNILNVNNTDFYIQRKDKVFPTTNLLLNKYRDYLITISREITLNDKSFELYRYRPKYLCLDLYGNLDLWYVILWLNNMISVKEFNKKTIRVIDPASIDSVYKIIGKEENMLVQYNRNITIVNEI